MITIYRAHEMRFVIFSNDHEPAHVHAIVGSGEAKINLIGSAEVVQAAGITRAEIRKALDVLGKPASLSLRMEAHPWLTLPTSQSMPLSPAVRPPG